MQVESCGGQRPLKAELDILFTPERDRHVELQSLERTSGAKQTCGGQQPLRAKIDTLFPPDSERSIKLWNRERDMSAG